MIIISDFVEGGEKTEGWLFPGKFPFDLVYKEGVLPDKEEHSHSDSYECFVVLEGHAELIVEGRLIHLTNRMVVVVQQQENHSFQKASHDFKTFIFNVKKG